jgi:alpha-2-macroglobulin
MNRSLAIVLWPFRQLNRLVHAVIGDIAWKPPTWARAVGSVGAHRPVLSGSLLFLVLALGLGGVWTWHWYANLPKPPSVSWIVNLSELPEPDNDFQAQTLMLNFDRSVARLDLIGKDVTKFVTLTPKINGKWIWSGGGQLFFNPAEDWPAATDFRVKLAPDLFSNHVRIDTLTKDFRTAPFTIAISESTFYVNPKDPATKQITATLTFSQPVDRTSLEKNLTLAMESGANVFQNAPTPTGRCTFTYDKRDRIAYLRSVNVTVPKESGHAILTVPTSVLTTVGHAALEIPEHADVPVPSSGDLFRVASAQATIVTNTQGEPEQALILTTSVGVKPELLAKAIHAWVLPKKKKIIDAINGHVRRENWTSPAQVTADDLTVSSEVVLTLVPSEQEYTTLHSFKMKVPEDAHVYVEVDKGLASVGGFTLGDKFASLSKVPPYPREVQIMHDGSLLALSGERKLSILSRGVEQLEFRLQRVTPSSINHLVSQSQGDFGSPIFNNYNFNETNITEQTILRQPIAATDTSKNDYSALDFSEFVDASDANRGKLGLFILRVLARKPGEKGGFYKEDGGVYSLRDGDANNDAMEIGERDDVLADRRLILVTDLGLLIKDNADGTHDVFVQSIKSGDPVGDAQVDVLGKNGLPVVSVKTDTTGHAAIPTLSDFKREKAPVAYVARQDNDVSFLPFGREDRELNFSRFDTSGVSGLAAHDLTAFVFTDRGIYRPGDEAKLGVIVKQRDWQGKLDGIPLRLDVVDPRGTVVQSRAMRLNAGGFLEAKFPTRETSNTGQYQVNCYLIKGSGDETLLGSDTLRVAEFLPDRLKIKATLSSTSSDGWVNGSDLKGLVSLENLYGSPSVGHRMAGKVTLDPSQFYFERYPDYTFTDPYLNPKVERISHEQDLTDQTTNDEGETTFDLTLANLDPSAYRLSFLAEGFEKEGGRSVTAGAEVLVSPRAWLVGVKPDGDFGYVHLNSQRTAQLLAVDSHLKPIAVEHLKLKLAELRYISVLVQKPNGNYAYESVLKELPVSETELAIPDKGLAWPLITAQPGDFAARLYDDHNDLVADIRYTVAGTGNVSRSLEKNAELSAKLSKPEYLPGEDVEVEITAPYTGAGLITIERDKVYAHAWFQAKTTTTVQKITLPKDFEGNGYLNVAFVRALDSKEIYTSPLSYAVLPFKVNQEARHTHIAIDVPKVAQPGEPLEMKISASRPTQAVVYAVDEGILQVARYTLPDPLAYFYRKQALEVGTRQTVDLILPEYSIVKELSAAGGDSDEDALAHHLNPFKRKHDAPVAYWSGIVDIGPEAKTFTYPVPDYFAGTVRIMVVANTADAVGSAEAKTQVRGAFVISPNVPTFVAPGDTFDVSVTVANNVEGSGPNASVNLDLQTTDGLEVTDKPAPVATIAEGRDASFHWKLRAKDLLGNADITVTASSGDKKSILASHLSVRPPVPYLTTLTSGYFKGDTKQVTLTRHLYPQYRKASALASPIPQGLSRGLGEYLEHYEYGCTEQLVSKAFPSLVTSEIMQQGLPRTEVATHIEEILDVAATRQSDDGAFGLWMAQSGLHFDLPSAWVMLFMTEAKEQGYAVPSGMMTRGLGHLKQDANGNAQNFHEARTQAFEIYLLARNGTVVTNALEHNRHWFEANAKDDWNEDIAVVYDAASYALLKNQGEADDLIKRFHLRSASMANFKYWDDFYDELGRNSQYIYLLALHFPDRAKTLTGDDLMELADPIMGGEYTTISSAQAILALDGYGRMMKDRVTPGSIEIDQMAKAVLKKLALTPGFYPEGSFDRDADGLIFKNGAQGVPGLFYQVVESGFEQTTVTEPLSAGIEVSREYRNQANQPVTSAKLGEELSVVVHVRAAPAFITNVAIEDLLPGGFEVVEESVHSGACSYGWGGISYVDVREDRVVAFGDIGGDETTITYRIKATNRGTYAIPPIQAEAMYHQKIRARGISGTLTVAD